MTPALLAMISEAQLAQMPIALAHTHSAKLEGALVASSATACARVLRL